MRTPRNLARYLPLAKRYLSTGRLPALLFAVSRKSLKQGARLGVVKDDLKLLLALANAWWRGEYRQISTQALLAVVATLVYFISPLDAIPDWLPGVGFLDDIAMIGWLMSSWRSELDAFRQWRERQSPEHLEVLERITEAEK